MLSEMEGDQRRCSNVIFSALCGVALLVYGIVWNLMLVVYVLEVFIPMDVGNER